MTSRKQYFVCGMFLESEIPLPGALESKNHAADATIRKGATPNSLTTALVRNEAYEANEHEILFRIPNVATYWIRDGREIVFAPTAGANETDLRAFLVTSAVAALVHQRGMLPLHASAVCVHGGVYGFLGNCGAGKSTLAAMLGELGFSLFADDVVTLQFSTNGSLIAHPGFRRLKLCDDALQHLAVDRTRVTRVRECMQKYELPVANQRPVVSVPLRRLYVIEDAIGDSSEMILPVRDVERLKLLFAHTYRSYFLVTPKQRAQHFQTCAEVLRRVPIFRFVRKRDLEQSRLLTQRLVNDFSAGTLPAEERNAA